MNQELVRRMTMRAKYDGNFASMLKNKSKYGYYADGNYAPKKPVFSQKTPL